MMYFIIIVYLLNIVKNDTFTFFGCASNIHYSPKMSLDSESTH
jgi:hypothetical protein